MTTPRTAASSDARKRLAEAAADLLPVQADDATIERACGVVYDELLDHEPPAAKIDRARFEHHAEVIVSALAAAGLLAGVRTGRSEQVGECGDTGPGSDFGYPKLAACRLPVGHPGDHSDSPRGGRSEAEVARFDPAKLHHAVCPKCREYKFVGHGPLCGECLLLASRAAQGTDTEGGGTC